MNERFTHVSNDDYIDPMHDDRADSEGCFRKTLYLIGSLTLIACLIYFLIQTINK